MNRFSSAMCIFALALALNSIGVIVIYSSSAPVAARSINARAKNRAIQNGETYSPIPHHPKFLYRQLVWFIIGMGGLAFFYRSDYNKVLEWSKWAWLFTLLLLLLVFLFGRKAGGARRWLFLGPITIQPSELAKFALVILTAKLLNDRRQELYSFTQGFLQLLVLAGLTICLIVVEDLGSAAVLAMIVCILWFIGEVRTRHILGLAPLGLAGLAVGVLMKPYRIQRIINWIFGGNETTGNWHSNQSLIAVGTGGVSGLGLGMGMQKYHYVAAMHTDFIFAEVCEEMGLIGAVGLLLVFTALFIVGFSVAYRTPDFVGAVLAAGMTTMIAVPVLVNVAVVLDLLPTKGLPLPFISYGGSSLLVNMCAIGLLMNIAERNLEVQSVRPRAAVIREPRFWNWGRKGCRA